MQNKLPYFKLSAILVTAAMAILIPATSSATKIINTYYGEPQGFVDDNANVITGAYPLILNKSGERQRRVRFKNKTKVAFLLTAECHPIYGQIFEDDYIYITILVNGVPVKQTQGDHAFCDNENGNEGNSTHVAAGIKILQPGLSTITVEVTPVGGNIFGFTVDHLNLMMISEKS